MDPSTVIRGSTLFDGTGGRDARTADIAVSDGVITEIGRISGRGHREIDADGRLVTPGGSISTPTTTVR